jgi:hypothetical protein
MNATLIRIGASSATGYAVSLYTGEEAEVLARAEANGVTNATSVIASDLGVGAAPAGIAYINILDARKTLAAADGNDNSLRDLGIQLFTLLNTGDVGVAWTAARTAARKNRKPTGELQHRTYLQVLDTALARLPWELMMDESTGSVLAVDEPWAPIVRYSSASPMSLGDEHELRTLLVIGCDPQADANIGWLAELRSFLTTVCPQRNTIDFEIFEASTQGKDGALKGTLRNTIQTFRPHVLHFVGHGRASNDEGELALFDSSIGAEVSWTAQEFRAWLQPSPPRLVLLNACRTAEQAANPDAPIQVLATMSSAALAAGVASVVAMQHDIAGPSAALFANGFYSAIVKQQPVDVAVMNGRQAILDKTQYGDRNWALPVVTTCASASSILPQLSRTSPLSRNDVNAHPDFAMLSSFVDRRAQRRSIIIGDGTSSGNIAFVVSDASMGKSSLAKVISEWRILQNHQVVYADCSRTGRQEPLNIVQLLRHIRGPKDLPADLLRPNLYASFATFNNTLNAVLNGKPVTAVPQTGIDNDDALDRNKVASQQAWDVIFNAFLFDLQAIGAKRPITIVIDHLSKTGRGVVFDDFKEHMVPRFLRVVRDGQLAGVFAVVVASEQELKDCGLSALCDASTSVRLHDFTFDEWELLAREFAIRRKLDETKAEQSLAMVSMALKGQSWKPCVLELYRGLAELGNPTARTGI